MGVLAEQAARIDFTTPFPTERESVMAGTTSTDSSTDTTTASTTRNAGDLVLVTIGEGPALPGILVCRPDGIEGPIDLGDGTSLDVWSVVQFTPAAPYGTLFVERYGYFDKTS